MLITIDTEKPLSADDCFILRALIDGATFPNEGITAEPEPAKPTRTRKAKAAPEPELEELSAKQEAVDIATKLAAAGNKGAVRDALSAINASTRVSELSEEQAKEFLEEINR